MYFTFTPVGIKRDRNHEVKNANIFYIISYSRETFIFKYCIIILNYVNLKNKIITIDIITIIVYFNCRFQ